MNLFLNIKDELLLYHEILLISLFYDLKTIKSILNKITYDI